jgi:hypothetical protein
VAPFVLFGYSVGLPHSTQSAAGSADAAEVSLGAGAVEAPAEAPAEFPVEVPVEVVSVIRPP